MSSVESRPATPTPSSNKPVAVIDIGTSSVRMAIAEISPQGEVRTLETLTQAVSLGKDAFTGGAIAKSTIEDCVRVLKSYRKVLREYSIDLAEHVRVVATSAVREATNRLAFVDRVYIATGFQVDPIDEAEVNRITFLGIQPLLTADQSLASSRAVVTEIGGGSTEMLLVKQGDVVYSHTYRLGSLRLRETLEAFRAPTVKLRHIMETHILRTVEEMVEHVSGEGPIELIAMGGDVRVAARYLTPGWDGRSLVRMPLAGLEEFTDRVLGMSDDRLVRKFQLSYPDAETLGPALLAYVLLARELKVRELLITNVNLRDGLLKEMSTGSSWSKEFSKQIIRSAIDLGRKYGFDEQHALHVADLSSSLFHQLRDEHQLPPRYEVILYTAALLHEVGLFVSNRSYHKHSLYVIRNSELFGLAKRDLLLAALIARYHRRASPQPTHEGYSTLDRDGRVAVAKLAAILRVAVALDESRSQRIHEATCHQEGGRLVISIPRVEDLSLEQLALKQNGLLFEETFGMPVLLRMARR
ncbi:Ppx/GppA phosphatase [Pirellula staleyi DSM 6068]|uniref:Ppx/GppA phosphatase n=1 Tax=Pirellula staleyi (strain ATCC 27377 / DSM 6068 / ICPB 4128) TaxID=530564 RepID=D2QYQ2_PIRSD|nr:Ppx/GppA phosphatase family protein [Pirellula staleyi]ADB18211.1 Ppx/GppA phosphatase [Pirellula staleyi DSM 6068]